MSKDIDLKLDTKLPNYERLCGFKTGDNLAVINGSMLQNSTPYDLTGLTLRVNFEDPEGNPHFQDGSKGVSIVNPKAGTFKINVLSSVLSVAGIVKSDISIFKGTQKLTSSTFLMVVEESVYNGDAIIGEDGKDLLQGILDSELERVSAEKIRESNEVGRKDGEVKRENAEIDRKAHEVVRESNEVVRKKGYSKMDERIDNIVVGQGSATEVIDARLDGVTNELYPTLKARLDKTSKYIFDSSLASLTTNSTITALENATNGIMQLESIKGGTLQNLCSLDVAGASTGIPPNDAFARLNKAPNLATGKTITLINNNDKKVRYSFSINGAESGLHDLEAYKSKKVTLQDNEIMRFMVFFKRDGWTDVNVKVSTGFILEGDYTTVNQPNHFDGIKSTGEKEGNKIEILSVGKNLFDKSTITKEVIYIANTGGTSSKPDGYISDYINVLPNAKYVVIHGIGSSTYGHCFYSSDKVYIGGIVSSAGYDTPQVITTPNNCAYIRTSGLLVKLDTQQLEKSDILTSYEDFKSDKAEIKLGSPLCGLSNGVTDEIIGDRVHRRIGKTILNGSEDWQRWASPSETTVIGFNLNLPSVKKESLIQTDKFIFDINISIKDKECITSGSASGGIYIKILKSKLTTQDVAGFKKWLSENKTEVYYVLADTTVSSINPTSLKSFKNGNIILNNAITPTVTFKYATSMSGRLSTIESTLDDTVDRTQKLEEGLLATVGQTIDNKNKIEDVRDIAESATVQGLTLESLIKDVSQKPIVYQNNFFGNSIVYKNNQTIFMEFAATLPSNTIDTLINVATIPAGYRPIVETNIIVAESAGTGMALLNITKNGDVRVRKFGSTGIRNISGNVNYITNN